MGKFSVAHLGSAGAERGLRLMAEAAASWLKSCHAVGLVVSTSFTSDAERDTVRALTERVTVRSAWAHSVGTGALGKELDAIIVVAPDAELLEWVIARAGRSERILVVAPDAGAERELEAAGSVSLDRGPAVHGSREAPAAMRSYLVAPRSRLSPHAGLAAS